MSYVALYRKFRPRTFEEVKGQEHVTRTLRNQVRTGRLQHAYLFCGTRGTGKTSVAKILARAVNCENPQDGDPCGCCGTCKRILSSASMNVIEIDAASNNGVDHIREIIDEVQYRPTEGHYKVYIIDEVHMLSQGAFNALLKTLEEPPEYVIFILATTEAGKIPVTILSRCQRYDFRRIDVDTIASRLQELLDEEGVEAEEKALRFIARAADGSLRDALSLLDRCIAFFMDEPLTYERVLKALGEADSSIFSELTQTVLRGDAGGALRIFSRQISKGVEVGQFVGDFIRYLRDLLIVRTSSGSDAAELVDATEEQLRDLKELSKELDPETAMRFIRVLSELLNQMRYASNRRVLAETAILSLARPQMDHSDEALLQRLQVLENRLEELASGALVVPKTAETEAPAREKEAMEVLPAAAPEDLRRICEEWRQLVASLPASILKQQLMENAHPQYNAETLENRLYVEFGGGMQETAADVVATGDVWREQLERRIEQQYGRHVDVEFHLKKARPQGVQTIDIDRMIEEKLKMSVEIADDDDDDMF